MYWRQFLWLQETFGLTRYNHLWSAGGLCKQIFEDTTKNLKVGLSMAQTPQYSYNYKKKNISAAFLLGFTHIVIVFRHKI